MSPRTRLTSPTYQSPSHCQALKLIRDEILIISSRALVNMVKNPPAPSSESYNITREIFVHYQESIQLEILTLTNVFWDKTCSLVENERNFKRYLLAPSSGWSLSWWRLEAPPKILFTFYPFSQQNNPKRPPSSYPSLWESEISHKTDIRNHVLVDVCFLFSNP